MSKYVSADGDCLSFDRLYVIRETVPCYTNDLLTLYAYEHKCSHDK